MSSITLFVRCFSDFENDGASCLTQIKYKEVLPLAAKGSKLSSRQEQSKTVNYFCLVLFSQFFLGVS